MLGAHRGETKSLVSQVAIRGNQANLLLFGPDGPALILTNFCTLVGEAFGDLRPVPSQEVNAENEGTQSTTNSPRGRWMAGRSSPGGRGVHYPLHLC